MADEHSHEHPAHRHQPEHPDIPRLIMFLGALVVLTLVFAAAAALIYGALA